MQIEAIVHAIFNENSSANSKTATRFVVLKQVREWSRILILNSSCPCTQTRQTLTSNFHSLSRKMWLFANDLNYRKIIFRWKGFFITSMNSGSLPQNKTPFGSDLLVKFLIARKCVPTIQILLSETEDTIFKMKLFWVRWHPVWLSKLAEEQHFAIMKMRLLRAPHNHLTLAFELRQNWAPSFWHPPSGFGWCIHQDGD